MLKIRLQRTGKKKQVYFRIILQEHSQKTKGKYLESLGNLDPHADTFKINEERLKYWLGQGAQVSDTVWNYLVKKKIVQGPKRQKARGAKKAEAKEEKKIEAVPGEKEKTQEEVNEVGLGGEVTAV